MISNSQNNRMAGSAFPFCRAARGVTDSGFGHNFKRMRKTMLVVLCTADAVSFFFSFPFSLEEVSSVF
jgi:hypothetical protein